MSSTSNPGRSVTAGHVESRQAARSLAVHLPARRVWLLALLALAAACVVLALWTPRASAQPSRGVPGCAPAHDAIGALPSAVPVRDATMDPPAISAAAAAVIDAETGRVLYDLNAHERRAPASTTKIMTAILAMEQTDPDALVTSETDAEQLAGSSVMGLRPGLAFSVRDLLYGLMLPSGNDAAIELARYVSGDVPGFVDQMNARAQALGMRDTNFRNPHGLDQRRHYSSAYDLSLLARYAMANEFFRTIVATPVHTLQPPHDYALFNGNTLLGSYPGAEGVKIGWTDRAGWTFVASAVRDGRRVILTVLDSEDRDADAAALFDWAFAAHRWDAVGPKLTRVMAMARIAGVSDALARTVGICA